MSVKLIRFHINFQSAKYKAVEKELEQVRKGLAEIAAASTSTSGADVDDLDSYMLRLQAEASGQKKDTSKLKVIVHGLCN